MLSTKPYFVRALYEWCVDQSFTPYISVVADGRPEVPQQYVRDGQIVLNIGPEAAHQLVIGRERITFSARFSGVAHALSIPLECVAAIYARENGHGMAFEVEPTAVSEGAGESSAADVPASTNTAGDPPTPSPDPPSGKPYLVRVK